MSMTAAQWKHGRETQNMTQAEAAHLLKIAQPYLSQLENGSRLASTRLSRKAALLYRLPSALPLPQVQDLQVIPDVLQREFASLGYPPFEHVRTRKISNPAEVVLRAVIQPDLDTRLVEALPWVLANYSDLNWVWLRDRAKVANAQNRLGYLVHLAEQTATSGGSDAVTTFYGWKHDLELARLAAEGTLCRDSMSEAERAWLRTNRPRAAAHWNLLTSLTASQLPYAHH